MKDAHTNIEVLRFDSDLINSRIYAFLAQDREHGNMKVITVPSHLLNDTKDILFPYIDLIQLFNASDVSPYEKFGIHCDRQGKHHCTLFFNLCAHFNLYGSGRFTKSK